MISLPSPEFMRTAVQKDEVVLIKSVCKKCGASNLVSVMDESLRSWESSHNCKKPSRAVSSDSAEYRQAANG